MANFGIAVVDAAQTTAMIAFIIMGSFIFNLFLAISRLPDYMGEFVTSLPLPPTAILLCIILFYLFIGCIMNIIAAIVITIPIIFPAIIALRYDPIWFGVIIVRMFEIGAISPPMGLNVFVLSGATGIPIGTIFRGIVPFLAADIVHVALIVAIPALSLYLPTTMG